MSNDNNPENNQDLNQLAEISASSEAVEMFDALTEEKENVSYKLIYARICHSVNAALLLSQIRYLTGYFEEKFNRSEFYKTNEELCEDIGGGAMGINAFKAAKRRLIHLKFITVVSRGTPKMTFYTLNKEKVVAAILAYRQKNPRPVKPVRGKLSHPSSRLKINQCPSCIGLKSSDALAENKPTNTKTTSKTTETKNTSLVDQARPVDSSAGIGDIELQAQAVELQNHWADKLGYPRFKASVDTKIGKKRFAMAMDVIAEFGLEDAKKIITGFAKAPPSREVKGVTVIYDSLELIFRDPYKIPGFRTLAESDDGTKPKIVIPPKERL